MTTAAPQAQAPPGPQPQPLWPQPIPVIGLTGEFASGKTLFGLTIDPRNTLVYDEEKSSASYRSLGFDRIDLFDEAQRKHPQGARAIDVFGWWLAHVRALKPGRYRVVMLDTVGTIESGLVDWVESHPEHFGHTRAQYARGGGLMWGDVKEHWKLVLTDLASRCETFVFTTHMGSVWKGNEPTGKRKPKGKETLMELASLYLQMERKADAKGNVPDRPAATVLKHRLMAPRLNPQTGDIDIVPLVPPRLPVATPHELRRYMAAPPDYAKLKPGERVVEEGLSEDERLQLRAAAAAAERDAEQLRLERMAREQAPPRSGGVPAKTVVAGAAKAAKLTPAPSPEPAPNGHAAPPPPATAVASAGGAHASPSEAPPRPPGTPEPATPAQMERLAQLRDLMYAAMVPGTPEEKRARWGAELAAYNVASAKALTVGQADRLMASLAERYDPFAGARRAAAT